jgi:hypothetical protein
MVGVDKERPSPQIGSPMAHNEHEPHQFTLICREHSVTQSELAAEEGNKPASLVKHDANAHIGDIALHNERLVEDWQLEHGRCHERGLEGAECHLGIGTPVECNHVEQGGEWGGNGTIPFDEAPVVPREGQEHADCPDRAGQWSVEGILHLLAIHGYADSRNHMDEVGNVRPAKLTLRVDSPAA